MSCDEINIDTQHKLWQMPKPITKTFTYIQQRLLPITLLRNRVSAGLFIGKSYREK